MTSPKHAGVHQRSEGRSEAPSISRTPLQPRAPPALTGGTKSSSLILRQRRVLESKTRGPGDPSERSCRPRRPITRTFRTCSEGGFNLRQNAPFGGISLFLMDARPSKGSCSWKRRFQSFWSWWAALDLTQRIRSYANRNRAPAAHSCVGAFFTRDQEAADFQVFIF